jgi:hypothetical protein
MLGNSWVAAQLAASQEGLSSMTESEWESLSSYCGFCVRLCVYLVLIDVPCEFRFRVIWNKKCVAIETEEKTRLIMKHYTTYFNAQRDVKYKSVIIGVACRRMYSWPQSKSAHEKELDAIWKIKTPSLLHFPSSTISLFSAFLRTLARPVGSWNEYKLAWVQRFHRIFGEKRSHPPPPSQSSYWNPVSELLLNSKSMHMSLHTVSSLPLIGFHPERGSSMLQRNVIKYLPDYMVSTERV